VEIFCKGHAYRVLHHRERRNRGFINERGVVTIVYGVMGAGKTALITDMALSAEVQLRDQAFEIILESDMRFPNFPWECLERELKTAFLYHVVYDVWSCRRWLKKKHARFEKNPSDTRLFGYDYKRYGLTYDNKLELVGVWQVIENYACAYVVYTRQSSLIVANYSIREDNLISDLGNFPLWDTDFFRRDSRLLESFSRHSHILDYDMLRLGKVMLKDNPKRYAMGFGVYVISEIDKEFKNAPSLQDVKASAEECNQKNELFTTMLRMCRHAVVIDNRVFIKIFADLQRPEDYSAGGRELGEIVYIEKSADTAPVLPFFSPFWLFETVYLWLKARFEGIYTQYRYMRSDRTLLLYALKNTVAALGRHSDRIHNLFDSAVLSLEVESGRMDGDAKRCKYFRQSKKIWAKRYSTDCLSGIFEKRSRLNRIGIDELQEYADGLATDEELGLQNSHFQQDVNKFTS